MSRIEKFLINNVEISPMAIVAIIAILIIALVVLLKLFSNKNLKKNFQSQGYKQPFSWVGLSGVEWARFDCFYPTYSTPSLTKKKIRERD